MRLGLGLQLTRQGVGGLSGSGVPADALGNLGDRYYDTAAGRWYLKRWVANREGAGDSILFPINLFPSVGDFEFSVMARRDNVPNGGIRLASSNPNGSNAFGFAIGSGSTQHSMLLRSSAGTPQSTAVATSTDTLWHLLGAKRIGLALTVQVDGVNVGTSVADTSAWSPLLTETGTRCLYTPDTASLSIKCCNLRLTGPGGSIIAPLNEGAGTTITNQAGANGTLIDGTPTNFWYQAWVPMDLLT